MPNRKPAQKVHAPDGPMLKIRIPQGVDETVVLYTLEGMFRVNLGNTPVLVYMQNGEIMRSKTQVNVSEALLQRLTGLVGKENVKMTGEKQ
jgi:DNA polymerase-3 subunit alpha